MMHLDSSDRTAWFRALHEGAGAFVTPTPWDVGSARPLAHYRDIVGATALPVSADLEKGCGDTPNSAGGTIRVAGFPEKGRTR